MRFDRIALRIFAAVFLYMSLGYLYMSSLSTEDLLSITGQVTSCQTVFEKGIKYNHSPIYIEVAKHPSAFRLMDVYDHWFDMVQSKVHSGDTVKIYYRTGLQAFIGSGKRYDAYQIEKGDLLVFPFSATKRQHIFSFRMMLFLSVFFLGLSFLIKRKRQLT